MGWGMREGEGERGTVGRGEREEEGERWKGSIR